MKYTNDEKVLLRLKRENEEREAVPPPSVGKEIADRNAKALAAVLVVALENIRKELPDAKFVATEAFDRVYSKTPDHIGTITVSYYDKSVARLFGGDGSNHALFGVTAKGEVSCYAN